MQFIVYRRKRSPWPIAGSVGTMIAGLLLSGGLTITSAQGVRMHVAPAVEHLQWADDLVFPKATLYGGRAGFSFGRLAALEGYYLTRDDLESELAAGAAPFTFGMRSYGADLQLNLAAGPVVPFILGGAGITKFVPEPGSEFERVTLRYGGGIRFGLADRLTAQITASESRLHATPADLATAALGVENPGGANGEAQKFRSLGVSLGYAIGGPSGNGSEGTDRWSLASVPIEPFVGKLVFEDDASPTNWMVGVRARGSASVCSTSTATTTATSSLRS